MNTETIVDVYACLSYIKQRLKEEGNETVTNCHQLKLQAADSKMRLTDVADTEQLFRIIQSIPSPKAEPFKQWTCSNDLYGSKLISMKVEYPAGHYFRLNGKRKIARQLAFQRLGDLLCWGTRIRTRKGRTRICSVTITPYPKMFVKQNSFCFADAKVRLFLESPKFFATFL